MPSWLEFDMLSGVDIRSFSKYLATTSTSMLTFVATFQCLLMLVTCAVCGMIFKLITLPSTKLLVRLIPSTVTEPLVATYLVNSLGISISI